MTALERIKNVSTRSEFATLLGFKPATLAHVLFKLKEKQKYEIFEISKKSGGMRIIKSPTPKLKKIQTKLSKLLNRCFNEIHNDRDYKRSLSHAFRDDHSIITNARNHIGKKHVFNVDLENFFPSINFGRVRGFFIKDKNFELNPEIATVIAQIACHENELPQGSPSSPVISNLIGNIIDVRMARLAKKAKCTYSRYADDLTFSTNQKKFSERIATNSGDDDSVWMPGESLHREIKSVGFSINNKKTSLQHKTRRQVATGLIVNQKVNIKKEYFRKARSMCNELFSKGEFYIVKDAINEEKIYGSINQLDGILGHIHSVKSLYDKRKLSQRMHCPISSTKLYREFLFYKNFVSNDMPLIICEGKTDQIYLNCALIDLSTKFQNLTYIENNQIKHSLKYLKISKNIKNVFCIAEGSSGLAALMDIYKKHIDRFKCNEKLNPVIILIDNDDGADEIFKKFNGKEGIKKSCKIDKSKQFYFFYENLYVIPTPRLKGNKSSCIEDFFEKKVLSTKLHGKSFNPKDDRDNKTEYGKHAFAMNVVKAGQGKIQFDGFEEIFNRISAVLDDYNKKKLSE